MSNREQKLEQALHGFIGFVRGGYAESIKLESYRKTLQLLTKQAEVVLTLPADAVELRVLTEEQVREFVDHVAAFVIDLPDGEYKGLGRLRAMLREYEALLSAPAQPKEQAK